MSKARELFEAAFSVPRDVRSPEYKAGVLDVLRFRLSETGSVRCPYQAGTAQADAYWSGCDEGHRRAREYLAEVASIVTSSDAADHPGS